MRIIIDPSACVGAGQCVLAAPELFDQREEDGVVVLLQATPAPALENAAREAATLCPSRAITLETSPGSQEPALLTRAGR